MAGAGAAARTGAARGAGNGRTRPRRQTAAQRAEARGASSDTVALGDPDAAQYRKELKAADRARSQADARGRREGTAQARARRGRRLDVDATRTGEHDDIAADAARESFRDERRSQRRADVGRVANAQVAGHNASGFVLGLLAYALVLNYLRGGWDGVRRWLAAKFLNQISSDATAPAPSTLGSAGPGYSAPTDPHSQKPGKNSTPPPAYPQNSSVTSTSSSTGTVTA